MTGATLKYFPTIGSHLFAITIYCLWIMFDAHSTSVVSLPSDLLSAAREVSVHFAIMHLLQSLSINILGMRLLLVMAAFILYVLVTFSLSRRFAISKAANAVGGLLFIVILMLTPRISEATTNVRVSLVEEEFRTIAQSVVSTNWKEREYVKLAVGVIAPSARGGDHHFRFMTNTPYSVRESPCHEEFLGSIYLLNGRSTIIVTIGSNPRRAVQYRVSNGALSGQYELVVYRIK